MIAPASGLGGGGGAISLARGVPAGELLPVAELRDAVAAALDGDYEAALRYGEPAGLRGLREWFGRRLAVDPERVLLTNGSLHALHMLAELLIEQDSWVAVEEPCYDFSLGALRRRGTLVLGVPMHHDGLDLDALEAMIETHGPPALLYTIPAFQNPTGATLAAAKGRRLVELARERGFAVVEDNPYRELFFVDPSPPTLLSLAIDSEVLHLTSLSKTIAPGLRCGAIVGPAPLVAQMAERARDMYIAPGHFAQATALAYCQRGHYEPVLKRIRSLLRGRSEALGTALAQQLDGEVEWLPPAGGYFAWVRLPGRRATSVARRARAAGVDTVPGGAFFATDGRDEHLRLSFAAADADQVRAGVERLAEAVHATPRVQDEVV